MEFRGAIVDVDGTVVRGERVVPGAPAAIDSIRDAGCAVSFVSNNPVYHRRAYRDRLDRLGFSLAEDEVITSGSITTEVLAADRPDARVFVVGEAGLVDQLHEGGVVTTEEPEEADVVVASIDRSFSYDTMTRAMWALADEEVAFVGTDPDRTIPTETREAPGSGAIIGAIERSTGRTVDRIMGKPSDAVVFAVERRLGVPAASCLVVGDRLDTDIAMGERFGMTTALVLTGVTCERDIDGSDVRPDHVLDSIADVDSILG